MTEPMEWQGITAAARELLTVESSYAADETTTGNDPDQTKHLRIAAIFILFATSVLGCLPPLLWKTFLEATNPGPRIVRALGGGVILALAIIHIMPDAYSQGQNAGNIISKYGYNLAAPCVIFGIFFLMWMEALVSYFMDKFAYKKLLDASQATECLEASDLKIKQSDLSSERKIKNDKVAASFMEMGCITHSLIIGLDLGVNTDPYLVKTLIAVLVFHQGLEGMALSAFIVRSRMPRWTALTMILAYSMTTPLGIAIGIAVADTYDGDSFNAQVVEGVCNGVAAGMLLYIGLIQIISVDFSRAALGSWFPDPTAARSSPAAAKAEECLDKTALPAGCHSHDGVLNQQYPVWLNVCMYVALFMGSAIMAIIGIWA